MNKPLMMIVDETRQAIYDAINNAGIHPAIIRDMILKDIYSELNKFADETINKEKELYHKESKKSETTNDELTQESTEE